MMKVKLSYGDGKVELNIPDKNLTGKISPGETETLSDTMGEFERVLNNPHGPHLEDLVKGRSVCVLVEDHTRDEPHWDLLNAISPRLRDANRVQ
ncbi:DUF2088 domain-containing protein, partial [Candidatus Thorarchaeota archaeon]